MTKQERAAMQQALEALEQDNPAGRTATITAIRAALAQQPEPAQEPVAWMVYTEDGKYVCVTDNPNDLVGAYRALPIYTTPPQRPPLTDEEMLDIIDDAFEGSSLLDVVRAIERKVRGEA